MIDHLSIAARDPKHSAEVLTEIMAARRCRSRPTRAAFSRCSPTTTAPGSRSTRRGPNCSPPARKAAALSGSPGGTRLWRHALRAQRRGRRGQSETDRRARWLALCDLQSRAVPRDRGLGRERYHGRGLAAGLRRRIPGLDPPDTVATRMTSAPSSGARHARARSARLTGKPSMILRERTERCRADGQRLAAGRQHGRQLGLLARKPIRSSRQGRGRDVLPSPFGTGNHWTASRALKASQIRRSARAVYVSGPRAVRL